MTGSVLDGTVDGSGREFAAERDRLFAIAYRMLGSAADADDVLQEAWIRWSAAPRDEVASPRAFLTTIVSRLCLDALGSARRRREEYVGPWLPEPIPTGGHHATVTDAVADRETLSLGFLLLLERLSPAERAVVVLREAFDYTHAEIGELLDMPEATVRQHLHRAHTRLAVDRVRFRATPEQHTRLFGAFLDAIGNGDVDHLRRLLADDVVAASDSGGKARAARKELRGPDHVARFFLGLTKKAAPGAFTYEIVEANGAPALLLRRFGALFGLLTIDGDGQRIHAVHFVVNPDKLARFA